MANMAQDVLEFGGADVNQDAVKNSSADDMNAVLFQNQNYLNQLSELMENITDKGAAFAQLRDGTVFVSENRIVVYKYVWDKNKCMFIKQRTRSSRNHRLKNDNDVVAEEDSE